MTTVPLIFDIRGFSLDDGPGIRTTVFFKGCPLSCIWCHNPESWSSGSEIAFHSDLCIGCGDCVETCPLGATDMESESRIDRGKCNFCGSCADACPSTALRTIGRHYPVDELVVTLLGNHLFYKTSGGGVTFSGGEPTLHMDYLQETATMLRKSGVRIAIQTSGLFDISKFREKLLPHMDLIYFDLKLIDPAKHLLFTGVDNVLILSNFEALAAEALERLIPRTPLIPGITDTEENLSGIERFIKGLGYKKLTLMPYNPGGEMKRRRLGMASAFNCTEGISYRRNI